MIKEIFLLDYKKYNLYKLKYLFKDIKYYYLFNNLILIIQNK